MKMIRLFLFTAILSNVFQLHAQSSYLAGTSQVSIEPDQSLISLHLAGYGAPRDGRFTLQWKMLGNAPAAEALAGMNNRLYVVSGGNLLFMSLPEAAPAWETVGKALDIISVSGCNGYLYAIDNKGKLYEARAGKKVRWKVKGSVNTGVRVIAASENKLYTADESGNLWTSALSRKELQWVKSKTAERIISLSAKRNKLYALTADGILYSFETQRRDNKWLKIAFRNNETIKEDIRHIAFSGDRIYGISSGNVLYLGEHRSEGNLSVRALAVKNGEQTVVIVNADLCGLADTFTGSVKDEIFQKYKLPPSALFINSAHTHFAPVTQNWLTWQEANQRPDSLYLYSTVKNGILNAVGGALAGMAPAELSFGRGTTDIGYNRSLRDHPELYDSDVDVIRITFTGSNAERYLFMTACHPVFSTAGKLHYTLSANYPGVARGLVEQRTGTTCSLFLQGTAGDINPRDNGEYITGEKLANEVIAILNRPMRKIEGPISFFLDTIKIPVTPWTIREIEEFREQNSGRPGDVYAEKNVRWCDLMLEYYNKGIMPAYLPEYVNTINIGNWKLVGFSRETTTGYSFGVKRLRPDKLISVAGYTNDVSSYLPTKMHLEAKGYEGLDSFFWYGMPALFPMNVEEIILNRIKELGR
jgi:hypothetical protein